MPIEERSGYCFVDRRVSWKCVPLSLSQCQVYSCDRSDLGASKVDACVFDADHIDAAECAGR